MPQEDQRSHVERRGVQKAQRVVPLPTLTFIEAETAARVVRLDVPSTQLVGRRSDNGLVLQDPRISRVHAEIRCVPDVVIVTDLGSRAGTMIDGVRLTGPTVIHHGARVAFGPAEARFEDPARAAVPEDPTLVLDMDSRPDRPRLSPRQQQVLDLMAKGMTNAAIGGTLGVTERTVKAYAQELYDKLGVRNRAGAVAQGARLGMLSEG